MMNEILNCIKLIKMYAWEKSFAKAISGMYCHCWSLIYIKPVYIAKSSLSVNERTLQLPYS